MVSRKGTSSDDASRHVCYCGYEGQPLDLDSLQYLNDQTPIETKAQIEKMIHAALADYQDFFKSDKLSIDALDAVDTAQLAMR